MVEELNCKENPSTHRHAKSPGGNQEN